MKINVVSLNFHLSDSKLKHIYYYLMHNLKFSWVGVYDLMY